MRIYLIGSLRNLAIPQVAQYLRSLGHTVVDDWYAAGPEADDCWQDYETQRGHTYQEALAGLHADHVFHFDLYHLNRADAGVLILPAGRSGHLEFGYLRGRGTPGYIVLGGGYDRFDVMYKFATAVVDTVEALEGYLTQR